MFWTTSIARRARSRFLTAVRDEDFAAVAKCFNRAAGLHGLVHVEGFSAAAAGYPAQGELCEIVFGDSRITIRLPRHPDAISDRTVADRLTPLLPMLAACHGAGLRGIVPLSIGDGDMTASVAFCSNNPDSLLIPDFEFLASRAYDGFRKAADMRAPGWERRKPLAVWRGSTTGIPAGGDWLSLPRIRLCDIARTRPDLFDAGISNVVQLDHVPDAEATLRARGIMKDHLPGETWLLYRYTIDIDGNTNAWSNLFTKLLSGSPVLKVASPGGHRQWYYGRLEPFVNFVPVLPDMSDLVEKLLWLKEDDDRARAIGAAGRALALSLGFETELDKARDNIMAWSREQRARTPLSS